MFGLKLFIFITCINTVNMQVDLSTYYCIRNGEQHAQKCQGGDLLMDQGVWNLLKNANKKLG